MKKVLVLGAGQLARMMDLSGSPLNMDVKAFDVRTKNVVHPIDPIHIYGDLEQGIAEADVITAEFEHVAHDTLALCEASGKLLPSSQAIKVGGDRRLEKSLLEQCQVANATHYVIQTKDDFDARDTFCFLILLAALDVFSFRHINFSTHLTNGLATSPGHPMINAVSNLSIASCKHLSLFPCFSSFIFNKLSRNEHKTKHSR